MNKQLMIVGAMTAARIFGDAVGRKIREFAPYLGITICLAIIISMSMKWGYDAGYAEGVNETELYYEQHCMVFGEQGDIIVPIEALEGDYNWTIR